MIDLSKSCTVVTVDSSMATWSIVGVTSLGAVVVVVAKLVLTVKAMGLVESSCVSSVVWLVRVDSESSLDSDV